MLVGAGTGATTTGTAERDGTATEGTREEAQGPVEGRRETEAAVGERYEEVRERSGTGTEIRGAQKAARSETKVWHFRIPCLASPRRPFLCLREKDLQKAFAAQVKVAQKELQKELAQGPPEDLEMEMEKLMKDVPADGDPPERPLFPSMSSELESAFPQLGNTTGGDIVMIWGFVQSFADIMALPAFSLNEFIAALHIGQKSALLSSIHIVLLRLIQADMEESHHLVLTQVDHPI